MIDRRLRIAGIVLAVLGLGVAGYLTYVHYAGIDPVCNIAHGCAKVQSSSYAELAGVPVALLGLLGYVGILAALLAPGETARMAAAWSSWEETRMSCPTAILRGSNAST